MRKLLIVCLMILVAGCTTVRPTWAELWGTPDTRTDLVDTYIRLDIVPYSELTDRCGQAWKACFNGIEIIMPSYKGRLPEGKHLLNVKFQFVSWNEIGNDVRSKDGTIYTFEHGINSPQLGKVGRELFAMLGFERGLYNAEDTLAHEVWHVLGYDNVPQTRPRSMLSMQ